MSIELKQLLEDCKESLEWITERETMKVKTVRKVLSINVSWKKWLI